MHREFEFFQRALSFNVDGYILKEEASVSLLKAVYDILNGGKYYSSAIFTEMAVTTEFDQKIDKLIFELLTKREIEIVKLIVEGNTSLEIAKKLKISHRTVETHRYRIFEKLRIKKVTDLIKIAIQSKLV
jgi:DNA-binding NarL/FixJ family response regulator